jgi:ankyrin repeat protein
VTPDQFGLDTGVRPIIREVLMRRHWAWAVLALAVVLGVAVPRGQAPDIFQSVRSGDVTRVKALLAEDPRLANAVDANGRTLLHAAVGSGSLEMARLLLDAGALVRVGDANLRAPIHLANQLGNRPMVELLLERGAVVDTRAIGAATPLIHASLNDNVEMARLLIERGADIDVQCNSLTTPLYFGVLNNNAAYVDDLLRAGAAVDVPDFLGRTPLMVAVRDGRAAMVESLVARGADPRRKDAYLNRSLLHVASIEGHDPVVETLVRLGLPVNEADGSGRTPLDYARRHGHATTASLLIAKGGKQARLNDGAVAEPAAGDAPRVVKLQNGAWAVETARTVLVMAYSEVGEAPAGRSLANGHVTDAALAGGKSVVYLAHDVHPESSRLGLAGHNPIYAMARRSDRVHFLLNAAAKGAYASVVPPHARYLAPGEAAEAGGVTATAYRSYAGHMAYLLRVDGLTIAWLTGVCDNYQPFKRDTAVLDALIRDGARPDVLLIGSPSGIGPEIGNGIRETYIAALRLQPRAVFAFGHEPLERWIRGQLERRGQNVTPLRTAGDPGDQFLLERRERPDA